MDNLVTYPLWRNPVRNADGTIDCEIEHPDYGWIPFTASPDDSEQHGRDLYAAILESGDDIPEKVVPIASIAAAKRAEIDTARDTAIDAGFDYTFGDTTDRVQTRARDRENIAGLAIAAQMMNDAGDTETTLPFRAASNATYQLTALQLLSLAQAAQQHVSTQYARSWQLKDQVDAALADEGRGAIEAVVWSDGA